MTDQDIKRLVDSAAASVQAYPDNLALVRKRAATMRRRRTLAVATALLLLAGAAVPVWISAMNRAASTSDSLKSSVQPMIIYPVALNMDSTLEKFDPSWRIAQIRPDRTVVGYPMPANGLTVEIFVLSEQGEIVTVGRRSVPGAEENVLCPKIEEFILFGNQSGNETRRVRLPESCELRGIEAVDGDSVYLRKGRDDIIVFNLATGQTRDLLKLRYALDQTFSGGTIAVVEPTRGFFTDGQQIDCLSDGWNIRTLQVATGEEKIYHHPGSPCDFLKGLAVSPDGTHVAFIQEHHGVAHAYVIDISTGTLVASRQIGDPYTHNVFGIAFADNKTAWVAWIPGHDMRPSRRLEDIVHFTTLPLNG